MHRTALTGKPRPQRGQCLNGSAHPYAGAGSAPGSVVKEPHFGQRTNVSSNPSRTSIGWSQRLQLTRVAGRLFPWGVRPAVVALVAPGGSTSGAATAAGRRPVAAGRLAADSRRTQVVSN